MHHVRDLQLGRLVAAAGGPELVAHAPAKLLGVAAFAVLAFSLYRWMLRKNAEAPAGA